MACGGELFHKIVERETYTEEEARICMRAMVEAIDFCHQRGVVHRDLKVNFCNFRVYFLQIAFTWCVLVCTAGECSLASYKR